MVYSVDEINRERFNEQQDTMNDASNDELPPVDRTFPRGELVSCMMHRTPAMCTDHTTAEFCDGTEAPSAYEKILHNVPLRRKR